MRSKVFNKIFNKIIDIMAITGSSDDTIQKPRYSNKQLETVMTAPLTEMNLRRGLEMAKKIGTAIGGEIWTINLWIL